MEQTSELCPSCLKNGTGQAALMRAAWDGHDKCVKLLIDNGADVNEQDNGGYTALMRAAWNGHDKCVQLFIDNGVNNFHFWCLLVFKIPR